MKWLGQREHDGQVRDDDDRQDGERRAGLLDRPESDEEPLVTPQLVLLQLRVALRQASVPDHEDVEQGQDCEVPGT